MKERKERTSFLRIMLTGFAFGISLGLFDSVIDVILFRDRNLLDEMLRPEPVEIWIRTLVLLLFMAFSVIIFIASRKREKAEESLRESEERSRALSDSSMDAIIMMDGDGIISYFNHAAELIFGYTKDEALGRTLHSFLVSEKARSEYEQGLPEFKRSGNCTIIGKRLALSAVRKDGSKFPIELSVVPIRIRGEWHAVGTVKDITERRHLEDDLKRLASTDMLTGVSNRRSGLMFLEKEMQLSKRTGINLCICFADVDGLKAVNDRYGHEEGDKLIRTSISILKETLRESDLISRLGGTNSSWYFLSAQWTRPKSYGSA